MNEERLRKLVKAALPPTRETGPKHDLWPAVRQRIDQQAMRVSLFDWALIVAALAWVVIDPQGALTLLYHL